MIASLLIVGGILMTLCAPPTNAADSHAEAGLLLTDFTTDRADLDWYLDGPFELRLASVRAYSAQTPFTLEHYRWKIRIVVSARKRDDARLTELQTELASAAEEFADRDMVLVTLLDDGTSTVGDQELTAAEAAATRAALGIQAGSFALRLIGKDGLVKLSTESATPSQEIFALIDTMPMRKRENPDR